MEHTLLQDILKNSQTRADLVSEKKLEYTQQIEDLLDAPIFEMIKQNIHLWKWVSKIFQNNSTETLFENKILHSNPHDAKWVYEQQIQDLPEEPIIKMIESKIHLGNLLISVFQKEKA